MSTRVIKRCLVTATGSLLTIFAGGAAAQAEAPPSESEPPITVQRLFVSDKLVLNVYEQADPGGARVATIETGDVVEALERVENFVRIRLADGREGWVGANYLTAEQPAALRLRELQRAQKTGQAADKKAAEEIARLKKEATALQSQLAELRARTASATVADSEGSVLETGSAEPAAVAVPPTQSSRSSWLWSFVVVLAGGAGFAAGYRTLAGRIRRKFGGLRIY